MIEDAKQYYTVVLPDPRGIMGGLRGKVGRVCKEFEDHEGGILGNVSESSELLVMQVVLDKVMLNGWLLYCN